MHRKGKRRNNAKKIVTARMGGGEITETDSGNDTLMSFEVNGSKKLVHSGQRPEIIEEDHIGSQGSQRAVVFGEEEGEKKNFIQTVCILITCLHTKL